jgi:hypothetical protein
VYSTPETSELSFGDEDWSAINLDKYEPKIVNIEIDPDPANPQSNIDVFAHVKDEFGEIANASLSYSLEGQNTTKNLPMELYYGNLSYGIFHSEIPALNNTHETTINAEVFFEDNLGYNTSYGSDNTETEITVYSRVNVGTATNTTNFEPNKTTTITIPLQTFGAEIQNVTLYYTTDNEEWQDSNLTGKNLVTEFNWSSVLMNPVELDETDRKDLLEYDLTYNYETSNYTYNAEIKPLSLDSGVSYWIEVYDKEGNYYEYPYIEYLANELEIEDDPYSGLDFEEDSITSRSYSNKVFIKGEVAGIETKNFSTNLKFQMDANGLDDRTVLPKLLAEIYKVDEDGRIAQDNQLTNINLTKTRPIENEGSADQSYPTVGIRNQEEPKFNTFSISGNASAYPFDEYNMNFWIAVPVKNASIETDLQLDNTVNTSWNSTLHAVPVLLNDTITQQIVAENCRLISEKKDLTLCENGLNEDSFPTILNVSLDFKRNHSIAIVVIPLLASFFLLGAIFIFDASTDIGNRLAVTLGVIALIFTLPEIINIEKPSSSGPTIADSMISIIIIAAISFTVSSIISSNSKVQSKFKHWLWIDRLVYFLVSSIIIYYFVFIDYPTNIKIWLIPLLLFALGYGLLLNLKRKKFVFKLKTVVLGLIVIGTILPTLLVITYDVNTVSEKDFNLSKLLLGPKAIYAGNSSYEKDDFGITKIWPTKLGGQEWYSNNDTFGEDIQLRYQDREMFDDSKSIRYYIDTMDYATNKGNITTTNHKDIARNGYIFNQTDWKNIEFTAYINASEVIDMDDGIEFIVRGEKHGVGDGCLGSAYRGQMSFEGDTRFLKEQNHGFIGEDSNELPSSISRNSIDPFSNKWIGIKMAVYNIDANGKENVKMELWVDEYNNGNWKKVHQWIDFGKWGDRDRRCGGEPDQIITWGGPIAQLRIDGANEVNVTNLSIREIDPKIT